MSKRIISMISAIILIACSVVIFPGETKAAGLEKTYTFSDLTKVSEYGLTSEIDADGALNITFTDQYKSQFYSIPSDIDPKTIEKVTFDVTDGNVSGLGFKLHTQEDYDSTNKEGTPVSYGKAEITATPGLKVKYFSLMSLNTGTTKATVSSVTFYLSGEGNPGEDDEEEAPKIEGENLIVNGNFDGDDMSMWGVELVGGSIEKGVSDTPIFDDVCTYGIIKGRTSPYDCFAQDVTSVVEDGRTYAFSFYAMLSDAYEGAPGEQRQVDFAPYVTSAGNTNYLGSYSAELSGSVSQQLNPGNWTLYSGTFKVGAADTLDKVVIRLLEQGTNYGKGVCVMGEYYVTGVSLIDLNLETGSIQPEIPDLKDTFTADFGEDMIVGTSLSGSEINDKVLMQLVTKHFNAVTLGNELKPDAHLGNGAPSIESAEINGQTIDVPVLNFSQAEKYLDYFLTWNEENPDSQIKIRGHVLTWHSQTPEWFFHEGYDASKPYVTPEVMNLRHEWYIKSLLEHYVGEGSKYKDLFYGWDVVNEAVSDSTGTYRNADEGSSWWAVYGSNEFIINAFKFANKYAPAQLELYYNDYNDCTPGKVDGIEALLNDVKSAEGTRIDGMGMQGHYNIDSPTPEQFEAAATKYGAIVGKIMLTELDFKASSTYDGTKATLEDEYTKQAHAYKNLYKAMKKVNDEGSAKVGGFIVWGVIDGNSWLQAYTGVGGGVTDGRPQCPLLFDDDYRAKPAFWGIVDPTRLAPEIKTITLNQGVKDSFAIGNTYSFGEDTTTVSFIPVWSEGLLQVKVNVIDDTTDDTDMISLFIDKYDSRTQGIKTKEVQIRRDEATMIDGGYEAVFSVELDTIEANATLGLDLVVTNGQETIVFNDTTGNYASSSKYYALAELKPFATIPKGSVTIDGEIEAAWAEAVDVIPGIKTDNPAATATIKLLWDEENLYALAIVSDPDLNKANEQVHEQDSFEIFIDETNSKAGEYNDATKQYRTNFENESSYNGPKCLEENKNTAVKLIETGYIIEGAYKWTEIKPELGDYIGLELQINDADASGMRIGTVSWNDSTNQCWSSPSFFGTAQLVEKVGEAIAVEPAEGKGPANKTGMYVGIAGAVVLAGGAAVFAATRKNGEEENEGNADTKTPVNTETAEAVDNKEDDEVEEDNKEE